MNEPTVIVQVRRDWDAIDEEVDRIYGEKITARRRKLCLTQHDKVKGKRYKQHGVGQGNRLERKADIFIHITPEIPKKV